jgi:hypothetical protein
LKFTICDDGASQLSPSFNTTPTLFLSFRSQALALYPSLRLFSPAFGVLSALVVSYYSKSAFISSSHRNGRSQHPESHLDTRHPHQRRLLLLMQVFADPLARKQIRRTRYINNAAHASSLLSSTPQQLPSSLPRLDFQVDKSSTTTPSFPGKNNKLPSSTTPLRAGLSSPPLQAVQSTPYCRSATGA